MKSKVVKTLPVLMLLGLMLGCGSYGDYSDYYDIYGNATHTYGITVWTNTSSNVDVFVNGDRIGTVTRQYESAPECGAAGCVMFSTEDGGTKITLRGESVDGRTKWQEKSFRLNRDCRKVQLITNEKGEPEVVVN